MLDACVGDGNISKWLTSDYDIDLRTNDIDHQWKADYHVDARKQRLYNKTGPVDFWITNPPFDVIDDILYAALENCTNVITLARLSVLEPTKGIGKSRGRRSIYRSMQPDMLIVLPRYCFRLNDEGKRSTDSLTCCWVGWGPEVPRITTVWTEPPPEEQKDKER